ncbi:MAG: hypothetical protein OZ921_11550 [Sorangiineae bacterium]|nr:hypothetical protein [Polyangiaceae bacterium]MEB2323141.1 hypothetical protein [Sorangiineae bacterium]
MTAPVPRRVALGVLCTSMALMTSELVVTRIFSVVVWYHFAFLAISVALFGMGAAALAVHLLEHRILPSRTEVWLARSSLALCVSIVLVDLALLNLSPDWFGADANVPFTRLTAKLLVVFLMAAAPFVAGGFTIALAITRHATFVHRLYFMDLLGAGVGCALVVPLLSALGGPLALLAAALLAALGALVFGEARRAAWATLAAVAVLGATAPQSGLFRVRIAKGIHLDARPPEYNRWNSFSMVTVLPQVGFRGWGLSPEYRGPIPQQKTLVIDMNAMTTVTRFTGAFEEVRYTTFDLSALSYRAHPEPKEVCVVGAGGGKDVLAALAAGARHVTAVEINPLIVDDVMRDKYREFSGGLYLRDDVTVLVEDGRTALRQAERRFDVINLSMVDTSAATAAGAYALTENSLYTADAFIDFTGSLAPGGVLSVASVSLPDLAVGARLASIARAAVAARGKDPSRAVLVVSTPWLATRDATMFEVLIRPDGWTDLEVARVAREVRELGFRPVYLPGLPPATRSLEERWIAAILSTRDAAALDHARARWPLDVSPTTDDHPFFFYQNRLRDLGRALFGAGPGHLFGNGLAILAKVAVVAVLVVGVFLLVPLLVRRREALAGEGAALWDLGYVACLGLGFMFVELGLVLRFSVFLGHPTSTLSVVLLTLLVASALGSRVLGRPVERPRRVLAIGLALLVVAIAAFALLGPRWLESARGVGPALRALLAVALIAPLGLLLGLPLPALLREVSLRARARVPWLWSVNSGTSVLGSVLATLTTMHAGITATLLIGAGFYVLALVLSFWVVRHAREHVPEALGSAVKAAEAG